MASWLINLLVMLGILAIVMVAAWYILSQMNLPDPIRRVVLIIAVVVVAVIGIILLLQLPGVHSPIGR